MLFEMSYRDEPLSHSYTPHLIKDASLAAETGDGLAYIDGNRFIHRFEDKAGLQEVLTRLGASEKTCTILRHPDGEIVDPETYLGKPHGNLCQSRERNALNAALIRTLALNIDTLKKRYNDQQRRKTIQRSQTDANTVVRRKRAQTRFKHLQNP